MDIFSTPAPIPTSIMPDLILAAIMAQAYSPDEHILLMLMVETESGKPARYWAIRAGTGPAPGCKTLPTTTSLMCSGLMPVLFKDYLKTAAKRVSGGVSLKGPRLLLQSGVQIGRAHV